MTDDVINPLLMRQNGSPVIITEGNRIVTERRSSLSSTIKKKTVVPPPTTTTSEGTKNDGYVAKPIHPLILSLVKKELSRVDPFLKKLDKSGGNKELVRKQKNNYRAARSIFVKFMNGDFSDKAKKIACKLFRLAVSFVPSENRINVYSVYQLHVIVAC